MTVIRASMTRRKEDLPRRKLLEVGAATTAVLRERLVEAGVIRSIDFIQGMLALGVMVQKDYGRGRSRRGGVASFHEALADEYRRLPISLGESDFSAEEATLRQTRLGLVEGNADSLEVLVAVAGSGIVEEIGQELGMTRDEMLRVLAFGVLLAVRASAKPGQEEAALATFLEEASLRIDMLDINLPSSREMFG